MIHSGRVYGADNCCGLNVEYNSEMAYTKQGVKIPWTLIVLNDSGEWYPIHNLPSLFVRTLKPYWSKETSV